MIHEYSINNIPVLTGDIVCTTDGGAPILEGQFWRFVGKLIPGDVDHVAVYVGPEGKCVEAGPTGVITFEVADRTWNSLNMREQRGPVVDTFYGIAYPAEKDGLSKNERKEIREHVADYCLHQAKARKPYNLNFLNSQTEHSFYCSQLVYMAYLRNGINLNTDIGIPDFPGSHSIIFPQELWSGCVNKRRGRP